MIESMLYEKLPDNATRCNICLHRCIIEEGNWGHCRTRQNHKGRLFSHIYGEVSVYRKAPIELKPVYHYLPGSFALSLGSVGCNFLCPGCQNWDISFSRVEELSTPTTYISPEEVIELAQKNECAGISWTYNEPTLWFEYTIDIAKLSKAVGLYTNYVTNGFMTPEALDLIGPYLDIFRVDLKAFCKESYNKIAHISKWEGILQNIKRAHTKWKMHIEIVTNVIPGYNANPDQFRAMAKWIKNELGKNTPWHITRFVPNWQLEDVPSTPVNCLEKIINIIKEEGLNNIYIGNVVDHRYNNTYCPSCSAIVIERDHYSSINNYLKNSRCPKCGEKISGHFVNSQ